MSVFQATSWNRPLIGGTLIGGTLPVDESCRRFSSPGMATETLISVC